MRRIHEVPRSVYSSKPLLPAEDPDQGDPFENHNREERKGKKVRGAWGIAVTLYCANQGHGQNLRFSAIITTLSANQPTSPSLEQSPFKSSWDQESSPWGGELLLKVWSPSCLLHREIGACHPLPNRANINHYARIFPQEERKTRLVRKKKGCRTSHLGECFPPPKNIQLPYAEGFSRGSYCPITLFIKQPNGLRCYQNGFVWTNHSGVSLRNPWVKSWQWSHRKSLRSHKYHLHALSLHFFIFKMEKTIRALHSLLGRLSRMCVFSQVREGKHSLSKPQFTD